MVNSNFDKSPHFELAPFPGSNLLSAEINADLTGKRVPVSFLGFAYRISKELVVIETSLGKLICFGTAGLSGRICLDPQTGMVMEVVDLHTGIVQFVNSSLEQFNESIRVVIDRFPFYDAESEYHERAEVAKEISMALRNIDSSALIPDGFWESFIADVEIGDFATEDILESWKPE